MTSKDLYVVSHDNQRATIIFPLSRWQACVKECYGKFQLVIRNQFLDEHIMALQISIGDKKISIGDKKY